MSQYKALGTELVGLAGAMSYLQDPASGAPLRSTQREKQYDTYSIITYDTCSVITSVSKILNYYVSVRIAVWVSLV